MDEGMEALLDFEEFATDAAPATTPAELSEKEDAKPPAMTVATESTTIIPDTPASPPASLQDSASVMSDTEKTDGGKSQSDLSAKETPAKKKRKTEPEKSVPSAVKKPKPPKDKSETDGPSTSTSQATEGDDDELDDLLDDGEDFEGDILDLLPLKEEDPEDVAERQKLQLLISHLSEEQLNRYEVYRRSSFPKASVRRIVQTVGGCTVSQNAVIAMAGIAKMHVGEIVETALDVKSEWNETGPVQPKHLREAARRLRNKSAAPSKYRKKTQTNPYP